ncbi:MAG: DUF1176 domain-containing protein, partial [Pseudomonadota bacterium]
VPYMFPIVRDGEPSVSFYAYNLEWDAEAGELVSFFKGRGVGDCGEMRRWSVVAGEIDVTLRLISSRKKDVCDGVADLDAPEWQPVWPTDTMVQ